MAHMKEKKEHKLTHKEEVKGGKDSHKKEMHKKEMHKKEHKAKK